MAVYKTTYKRYNGSSWDSFYFTPAPHTHTLTDLTECTENNPYGTYKDLTFSEFFDQTYLPLYKHKTDISTSLYKYSFGTRQIYNIVTELNSMLYNNVNTDTTWYTQAHWLNNAGVALVQTMYRVNEDIDYNKQIHTRTSILYNVKEKPTSGSPDRTNYSGIIVTQYGSDSDGNYPCIYAGKMSVGEEGNANIEAYGSGRYISKYNFYTGIDYTFFGSKQIYLSRNQYEGNSYTGYTYVQAEFILPENTSSNIQIRVGTRHLYELRISNPAYTIYLPMKGGTLATTEDVSDIASSINTYQLNVIDLNRVIANGTLPLEGGSTLLANGMTLNLASDAGASTNQDVTVSISVDEYDEDGGGIWFALVDEDDTMLINSRSSIYEDRNLDYMMNNGSEATGYCIKVFGCADTSDYMVSNKDGNGFDLDNLYPNVTLLATITYDIDEQVWRIES